MGGALRIARAPKKERDVVIRRADSFEERELPEVLTPEEAARALLVSLPTLRRIINEGGLPVRRVGTVTRIGRRALLRWLNCEGV